MRLSVNQEGGVLNEVKFKKGPIYLGRQAGCQVFLPDRSVSRQHAVIYEDGSEWILEDLDSANKTYLNQNAVHKSRLQNKDVIQISNFRIEVFLGSEAASEQSPMEMQDTLATVTQEPGLGQMVRKLKSKTAPPVKFPVKRLHDFEQATHAIFTAGSLEALQKEILQLLLYQFSAHHGWVCLRKEPDGPMDVESGRSAGGIHVKLTELAGQKAIKDSLEDFKYYFIPHVPRQVFEGKIRSAIVAPVLYKKKCHGILYAENSTSHEHYDIEYMDYLILLSLEVGAAIDRL